MKQLTSTQASLLILADAVKKVQDILIRYDADGSKANPVQCLRDIKGVLNSEDVEIVCEGVQTTLADFNAVSETRRAKEKPCPNCQGTGRILQANCPVCLGSGAVSASS
jgi:hypothetical protein